MKSIVVAVAVMGLLPMVAVGQDPGGVVVEVTGDAGRGQWSGIEAKAMAEAYLRERGWTPGSNDGGRFIVAVATEPIPCGPHNANFGECRRLAFRAGMIQAKQTVARFLAAEVSTAFERGVRQRTERPTASSLGIDGRAAEGMSAGMLALMGGSLACLHATGDASGPVLSAKIRSAIEIKARAEVSGLQAYRTFESIDADGRGQVAIVAVYSDRGHGLRNALVGRGPAATGTPGPRIADWAASLTADELLYMFGPQYRFDERGNLVLIGFGQSVAASGSGLAEQIASERAEAIAIGSLREYLGELVASQSIERSATSVDEFVDGGSTIQTPALFIGVVEAVGAALDLRGVLPVHSWRATHPQASRPTMGVVVALSVADAVRAAELHSHGEHDAASRGLGGPPAKPPSSRVESGEVAPTSSDTPHRRWRESGGAGAAGGEP